MRRKQRISVSARTSSTPSLKSSPVNLRRAISFQSSAMITALRRFQAHCTHDMIAASVGVVGMVPKIARPEVELVEVGRATRARAVCRVAPPDGGGAGQFSPWGPGDRRSLSPPPLRQLALQHALEVRWAAARRSRRIPCTSRIWSVGGKSVARYRAGEDAPHKLRPAALVLAGSGAEFTRPWSGSEIPSRVSGASVSPGGGARRLRRPGAQLQRLSQYLSSENYPATPGPIGSAMNLADGVETLATDGKLVGAPLPELSAADRRFLRLPSRSLLEPR